MFRAIKFCFSLVSFSYTFRVIMFIEAGDVTHRRRGQNRNEGLSKNFKVFYTENFLTQICVFWHNSSRNDRNKIFPKIKISTPLIFGPP